LEARRVRLTTFHLAFSSRAPKSRISAQEVLKNPALARLIVQAARKVREQKEGIKEGI
jgi:hypothetical protein